MMQSQGSRYNVKFAPVAYVGLLAGLALIFSYIESLVPFAFGIPGVKLGVANLVVIITLYLIGFKSALFVNIIRIFIAGLLFSGVFGILYSLAGGLLSLLAMVLLKKTDKFSVVGISVSGAVVHNFAQVMVAAFLVSDTKMFLYFPALLFSAIGFGIIMGVLTSIILERLPNPSLRH